MLFLLCSHLSHSLEILKTKTKVQYSVLNEKKFRFSKKHLMQALRHLEAIYQCH